MEEIKVIAIVDKIDDEIIKVFKDALTEFLSHGGYKLVGIISDKNYEVKDVYSLIKYDDYIESKFIKK
jgi:hypothetical protein